MDDVRAGFLPAPGMDYDRAFEYADEFGLDYVEVYAEGDPWREGALSDPDRVRDRLDDHGLGLLAHLPFPLDVGSPVEAVREGALAALDQYVEAVARRGAEKAVLHLSAPSHYAANRSLAEVRPTLLDSARTAASIGREHGVEVCVENVPSGAFPVDEFERVLAETDVSMTLDTGHAALTGWTADETVAFVREHADRVSHVHLNDNRATRDGWRSEDEHLPLGAGSIDFETLLAPATDGDWAPTLTMEIVTWDPEYVEASVRRLDSLLGRSDRN
ncbi:MAG: sugar phosphate isomerase/epimerase family protein [Haloarculaceae archaeon]